MQASARASGAAPSAPTSAKTSHSSFDFSFAAHRFVRPKIYLNVERALICLVSHASREVKNKEQHCNFMTKKTFMFKAKCDVRARKLSNEKEGGESGNFQNDLSSTLQKV